MAISEIGVSFPDATFGKESRDGVPFTYILRDVLQCVPRIAGAGTFHRVPFHSNIAASLTARDALDAYNHNPLI